MDKATKKTPGHRLTSLRHAISGGTIRLLRALIRVYQLLLSPLLGPRCRFYPSCSEYSRQAISTHGLRSGTWLSIKRIGRCHPGHGGGVDEVPPVCDSSNTNQVNG